MKTYKHLTPEERYMIERLRKAGYSQEVIADRLDRAPSTISLDLRRNRGERGYRHKQAQRRSK